VSAIPHAARNHFGMFSLPEDAGAARPLNPATAMAHVMSATVAFRAVSMASASNVIATP